MDSRATYSAHNESPGLLIAVAGTAPGSGVTTTTVALARTWPGPEPAVIVEADPAGGHLATSIGADPYRGLASMARAAAAGAPARALEWTAHVQQLPGGVAFLASPPGPDRGARSGWIAALLTGDQHGPHAGHPPPSWNRAGATVIADCGAPEPGSAIASILARADARLLVVHADRDHPAHARRRILELTATGGRRAVLLIDPDSGRDYATELGLPIMACLPADPGSAATLLRRSPLWTRRNQLLPVTRPIATAIDIQLRPTASAVEPRDGRPAARRHGFGRRRGARPTVYRIDLPASSPRAPGPALYREASPAPHRAAPDLPTHIETGRAGIGHQNERGTDIATTAAAQPATSSEPSQSPPTDHGPDSAPAAPRRTRWAPLLPGQQTDITRHEPDTDADLGAGVGDTEAAAGPTPRSAVVAPDPMLASPATVGGHLLVVQLFGPTQLWLDVAGTQRTEITGRLQPQSLELLAVLGLHPGGMTRDELLEALWSGHLPAKPNNALNNAISRLRIALGAATGTDGHATVQATQGRARYRLEPAHVRVDYWDFTEAVTARRRATTNEERAAACQRIIDIATAPLAPDLSQPWIEPMREATRRDALNALGWLASHTVTTDPRTTLDMLETAAETDPYNEALWQDILRLHAKLGEYDALTRTYTLLSRKLTEIDATPSRETQQLLHHLQHATR
ncbi:BTAD domain-containing putative transcriptional regulator [Nocardia nova]|uniref:BTAD domain-containing putative transcriptional regulator n=1 Tax=Nocardia nova TaxID=37330 RepID=UPI0007A39EFE|nr:BTAD domain-containing putative transcriptional regulator [Nocardia nova]